ncbi:MAG: hypothetical protein ABIT82_11335, partial [Ramlibacter sp.]
WWPAIKTVRSDPAKPGPHSLRAATGRHLLRKGAMQIQAIRSSVDRPQVNFGTFRYQCTGLPMYPLEITL